MPPDIEGTIRHQVLFHIGHVIRDADDEEVGPFSGLDGAQVSAETKRSRADQRGALQECAGRHARRDPAGFAKLGEHVQVGDAGEAIGAESDGHSRFVEAFEGW